MKQIFKTAVFLTSLLVFVVITPKTNLVLAQTNPPAVGITTSATVQIGSVNTMLLTLMNNNVPLKRAEISVRFVGGPWPKSGLSFTALDTSKYGLKYVSHYFTQAPGNNSAQELNVVYEATSVDGYNQDYSQVALATISYTVEPGVFSAIPVNSETKLTMLNGDLVPNLMDQITSNFTAQAPADWSDLSSYNLSFESNVIRKWWPTAPNTVQQIDGAIWKDSDGNNVKRFVNLQAEWQVDPNFFAIADTSSSYFDSCPLVTVGNRPCILFAAHVVTKNPGNTSVRLTVTDPLTGHQVWNAYDAQVYQIKEATATPIVSVSPIASGFPVASSQPLPSPSFIPENKVSVQEFNAVQQKVTYLQAQVDKQQGQIGSVQTVLNQIVSFLKRLFRF